MQSVKGFRLSIVLAENSNGFNWTVSGWAKIWAPLQNQSAQTDEVGELPLENLDDPSAEDVAAQAPWATERTLDAP